MFGKWANAPGPVIGFYRIGLAAIILLPVFLYRQRKYGVKFPKAILLFPLLGGIFTALDHGTWNSSLRYTSAANATLLGNTAPLWVALFAWLILRQKLKGSFWVGLAFALGGAVIVLGSDFIRHPSIGLGDLLGVGGGCVLRRLLHRHRAGSPEDGYALVCVAGRRYRSPYIAGDHPGIKDAPHRVPDPVLPGIPGSGDGLAGGRVPRHRVCPGSPACLGGLTHVDRSAGGDGTAGNPVTGGGAAYGAVGGRDRGADGHLPGAPQPGKRGCVGNSCSCQLNLPIRRQVSSHIFFSLQGLLPEPGIVFFYADRVIP